MVSEKILKNLWVLYSAANDPQTGKDPQIGPQMILNRKWSPMWTANDPPEKENGMEFGFLDFFNFLILFLYLFIFITKRWVR